MFGTIGPATLEPGQEAHLGTLMEDWRRRSDRGSPDPSSSLSAIAVGAPNEVVFIVLTQDEATYRQMAAMPEQDAWFHRMAEHVRWRAALGRRRNGVGYPREGIIDGTSRRGNHGDIAAEECGTPDETRELSPWDVHHRAAG